MSIQVNKSDSEVIATIRFDSSAIDEAVSKSLESLSAQRESGLAPSESFDLEGEKVSTPKTPQQIESINSHYDILSAVRVFVLAVILLVGFSSFCAESVSVSQKGVTSTVTITIDVSDLLTEYNKAATQIPAQRQESLADRVSKAPDGSEVRVALTQQQKDFVNAEYDRREVDLKRQLQLRIMDKAGKALNTSIQRASVSDVDIAAQKAAAKAKVDEEFEKSERLKPAIDLEIDKKP